MATRRAHLHHWRTAPVRTQCQTARLLGVTRATISKVENNAFAKIPAALANEPMVNVVAASFLFTSDKTFDEVTRK